MMTEDGRRQNVIHQSLTRPILLAGAERPLAISNWIIAAALILGVGQWFTVIAGVVLAILGHWVLVELAKIDPQLSQIYRRHLRHRQAYYPARASIWAPPPARVRPTVPTPKQMKG
jgi:type IV secretion system protein TrbD